MSSLHVLAHRNFKRIHIERRQFKIRGTPHRTRWYRSVSTHPLDPVRGPPAALLIPPHGSLYVHENARGAQVWMFVGARDEAGAGEAGPSRAGGGGGGGNRGGSAEGGAEAGRWVLMREGAAHPDLEGYVLLLHERYVPRWVTVASAKNYRSAKMKRLRAARNM